MTRLDDNSRTRLKSFIERIERLDEKIKALNSDKSEVFKEAKFTGFDIKAMREVLKRRRMETHERYELETLVDLYLAELGMDRATRARTSDTPHDPDTGEILTIGHQETELVAGAEQISQDRQSGESEARDSDPTYSVPEAQPDEQGNSTAQVVGSNPTRDAKPRLATIVDEPFARDVLREGVDDGESPSRSASETMECHGGEREHPHTLTQDATEPTTPNDILGDEPIPPYLRRVV